MFATAALDTNLASICSPLPPNLITVQTRDSVVYLSGVVSAGEFREAAESVAHEAPGAMRIVNRIAVSH
jgi:osmotically-inducible protein OsmY